MVSTTGALQAGDGPRGEGETEAKGWEGGGENADEVHFQVEQ